MTHDIGENWKAVPGFEGLYEVSDLGRVRSLDRVVPVRLVSGSGSRRVPGKVLSPGLDSAGYLSVSLGKGRGYRVHHLVMAAFGGAPPEAGAQRLHCNGVKTDNRFVNLRFGSRADNMNDMALHGQRKLSPEQVREIRAAPPYRGFKKELGRRLGVSVSTIQDVRKGRSYAHVR